MFLQNLRLTNFRNFSKTNLDFALTTVLIGNNAQGKSNLLESIYFLATSKSPRAEKDSQLIKHGEEFVRVEGEIGEQLTVDSEAIKLEIVMQIRPDSESLEKRTKVNGLPKRVVDYIGNLVVVYFTPEDINLVTGAPTLRRAYIDLTLSQVDKQYKSALVTYYNSLLSKNRLLKKIREGLGNINELDYWIGQMVESGKVISSKRGHFFTEVNRIVKELNTNMGQFSFDYLENILSSERIKEYQNREIAAGVSLIGPHRDDFFFKLNGENLAFFGSRGEQRTAVLDLKLAELQFINEVKNTRPVLLLDDVFSELDETHREYVTSIIGGQQTILSAVENERIPEKLFESAKIVKIKKGEVES